LESKRGRFDRRSGSDPVADPKDFDAAQFPDGVAAARYR
jgi:hypothetical protein